MSSFAHKPVLLAEVIAALRPHDGGRYVDGTLGGAGHAEAILQASAPTGWLGGCDRDGAAIAAAASRLAPYAGRWELRRGTFAELPEWISPASVNGVLLDLGVSSPQLDQPARGFSFQHDGPLDMRMDDRQTLTAAEVVNTTGEETLANIFWELGEERQSRKLARGIVRQRDRARIETTAQLAAMIEQMAPRRGQRIHPATRVFQALRMHVNDEAGLVQRGLPAVASLLRPGGRLAVITFHSLEARLVKQFGDSTAKAEPATMRWVNRKVIKPSETELTENPRSRSACLRVLEKC